MSHDPDHYLTQPMDNQEAAHNRRIAVTDENVAACAQAIRDLDRITPPPLTAEDQARAVLEYLSSTTTAALNRDSERLNWFEDWGYEYDGLLERGWGIGLPANQKGNTRDLRAAIDAQMGLNFDRRFVSPNIVHEPHP